ncbi:serine decarboxylase 1-like [Prosopis cineraria]|uniref:serine decarboxylase 1-like n=1 Tax=Prosopis cineraria TaxID=364024 RepID=UPI00240F0C01|nr:serine decarboxylase 1-like [Prosopis cineraria]
MENLMVPFATSALVGEVFPFKEEEKKIEESALENGRSMISTPTISQFHGVDDAGMAKVIAHYVHSFTHIKDHILGYPTNLDFNYDALVQLLRFHLNNAGDPFIGNGYSLNSKPFELCVLDWFAKLWQIEKNEYWGYVTSGGTEGNFHGILLGRELYPDGILYTSRDSHYSVLKVARLLRIKCVVVGTLISGEIDYKELKASLLLNKDKPAIINLNIGTTLKGAIDDLDLALQSLEDCGFTQDQFCIHCDAALFGMMVPFDVGAPDISFKKPIGSITTSGHKFLGCPMPCGILITRLKYIDFLSREVEYIASRDATISGSRGGHAPIFIWYALNKKGFNGLREEVQECIKKAVYLQDCLRDHGIGTLLNKFSNTVVFERPQDDAFARKWSLANKGNVSHVVVMQHVSEEMLDSFVSEFVKNRSGWYQDNKRKMQPPCVAEDIGVENCACAFHKMSIS